MIFQYTALNRQGARLTDVIEADDLNTAQRELLQRGLMVLEVNAGAKRRRSAPAHARTIAGGRTARARGGEVVLFTKQMSMMLQAGAPILPALTALRDQVTRPAWRTILTDLCERVEQGSPLHEALAHHDSAFPPTLRSIVRAGEATGKLAESFGHLARLLEARHRIRAKVVGALAYPALLLMLAIGVTLSMAFFILPRFAGLFEMLQADLPTLTILMLKGATALKTWWPIALGVPVGAGAAAYAWSRTPIGRKLIDRFMLYGPWISPVVAKVHLTQLFQIWGAALRSRVPLLETIEQAREASRNSVIRALVADAAAAVESGESMSSALRRYSFVPRTVLAATAIGEESGKLADALEFVGAWLEEESSNTINNLTRVLEPLILIVMGVVVGGVAIALFLPLFELASAA